jgi:hypothetical protein
MEYTEAEILAQNSANGNFAAACGTSVCGSFGCMVKN